MKENKVFTYIKEKGFYIALAVCIVGASGAAWVTANRTLDSIEENNQKVVENSVSGEEKKWGYSELQEASEPAAKNSDNVVKPSPSSSSSSRPSSSSSKPSEQPKVSTGQNAGQKQQVSSYILPVASLEVINPYSKGQLVKNQTLNVWRTHDGVDMKGNKGDTVVCVADGTVLSVVTDPLWGGTVQVQHPDGYVSVYCGVSVDSAVKKDAAVKSGQAIGTLDQIPAEVSMDTHLHFSVMKNGKYIDPAEIIKLG
ncbi:MAG: M23 family metallopeptidase [Angelakisella sp.]|nr:M23 family metallopeptidase [Angelakisella sp.]